MTLLPALLCAMALAADPDPGGPAPADAGAPPDAATADATATPDAPAPAPAPVTRHYVMRQTFTSEMRDPNPFSRTGWRSTHTNTYATVSLQQTGEEVRYDETTCSVVTEKVFGASTIYTDAFIKAIPVRHRKGKLMGDGPGARFLAGPYVQSFGVKLDDPYNDPLPTSPDDPRLVDTDKDGNPGTTVVIHHPLVGTGEVYVAQRSVARLEGALGAGGVIEGVIYTAPDMYKIEANRWWLRGETPQRQHPDPKMSPFIMVPVDAPMPCAKLLSVKDTVFPPLSLPQ